MAKVKYTPIRYEPTPAEGQDRPAFYLTPVREEKEEDLEQILQRFQKRQLLDIERRKLIAEMVKPEGEAATAQKEPKRNYLVDQQTGVIISAEDGQGELTYKEALQMAAQIKASKGQFDEATKLLNTAKGIVEIIKPGQGINALAEPPKKKEFEVDQETGQIIHDPENGELTLSQARAISASIQKGLAPRDEPITPEKLELLKRDMQDELRKNLGEITQELKRDMAPREEEPPFITDDRGELQLNPRAKVPGVYLLLHQLIKQTKQDTMYRDADGNVMRLPEWLEVRQFEREERRKDDRTTAMVELLHEGRKELPGLAQGLKNITRSGEAEQAMKKGGWLKEGQGVKTTKCAGCGGPLSYANIPAIIACDKCGAMNAFGSEGEIASMRRALAPAPKQPLVSEEAPPQATKEEQLWQESEKPPATLSVDLSEDTSKEESGPESRPTSKRSRKTGSAKNK